MRDGFTPVCESSLRSGKPVRDWEAVRLMVLLCADGKQLFVFNP